MRGDLIELACFSLVISDTKYFSWASQPSVFTEEVSFGSPLHFLVGLLVFTLLNSASALYVLDISSLPGV